MATVYAPSSVFVRPLSAVIVQARAGRLPQVSAAIQGRELTRVLSLGPFKGVRPWASAAFTAARAIPAFDMHAAVLDAVTVSDLAQSPDVAAIYEDRPVRISQFPSVPAEGTYSLEVPPTSGGRSPQTLFFTSTEWTRRLLGADVANAAGFSGQGVKACVVDTGGGQFHPQTRRGTFLTAIPGNHFDVVSHGCIEGEAYIRTTFCGVATMRELFDRASSLWGQSASEIGDTVTPPVDILTIGFNATTGRSEPTRVLAIHRIPHRGRLVRVTGSNGRTYTTTPWHPFLTCDRRTGRTEYRRADRLAEWAGANNHYIVSPDGVADLPGVALLSPEENYLAGLYIAEGFLSPNHIAGTGRVRALPRLIYSLSEAELPVFGAHLTRLGYGHTPHGRNAVQVFSATFVRALVGLGFPVGGRKATTVTIPEPLLKQPKEHLLALVAGIVDGDGSFGQGRVGIRIATSSRRLAEQLTALLSSMGHHISLKRATRAGRDNGHGGVAKVDGWHVSVLKSSVGPFADAILPHLVLHPDRARTRYAGRWDNGTAARKGTLGHLWIKRVEEVDFDGYLYDLTTSTGNYAAGREGMAAIHNTWCLSALGGTLYQDHAFSQVAGVPVLCEGMAPLCGLLAIKALDFVIGTAPTSILLSALEMALAQKVDVLSLSWGGPVSGATPAADPFYPAMAALDAAGVLVFAAAGNSGPGASTLDSPGALPQPVTVGAWNALSNSFNPMFGAAGSVCNFSSRGPTPWGAVKPDCVAPGAIIDSGVSAFSEMAVSYTQRPHEANAIAGTSMSTPQAAGIGVLARQAHAKLLGKTLTSAEVKAMLVAANGPPNNVYGSGALTWDVYRAWLSTQYGVTI
ncbi:MAG: S8 family serine peptidase [Acidimicrobiales bacterium]|nr:S8 family serine peptidase [Acidimicrobiales bacterium]